MTTSADLATATSAVAAVTDAASAKTALQAVLAVLNDLNTTLTSTQSSILLRNDASTHIAPADPHANGSEIGSNSPSSDPSTAIVVPGRTTGANWALVNFTTASLPNGTHAVAYSQQLAASGGYTGDTLSYSVNSKTPLPAGLTLSSSGLLSGTPTTAGAYSFVLTVADQSGNSVSKLYSLIVA